MVSVGGSLLYKDKFFALQGSKKGGSEMFINRCSEKMYEGTVHIYGHFVDVRIGRVFGS